MRRIKLAVSILSANFRDLNNSISLVTGAADVLHLDIMDGNFVPHITFGPLVVEIISVLPREYALSQNYPNPFNPLTSIQYALPEAGQVELVVYNIMGHQVRRLVSGRKEAGYHKVLWNGRDDSGREVPSGIYFLRVQAGEFIQTKRMVLLK